MTRVIIVNVYISSSFHEVRQWHEWHEVWHEVRRMTRSAAMLEVRFVNWPQNQSIVNKCNVGINIHFLLVICWNKWMAYDTIKDLIIICSKQ